MENIKNHFLNPNEDFTPIPFWFWNDELEEAEIIRQIHDMKEKSIDGFVIHPRIGMPESIPYLSDAFFKYVQLAVAEAAKLDMRVILYDEGMYPSGSACGLVVKENPSYASRGLRMQILSAGQNSSLQLEEGDEIVAFIALHMIDEKSYDESSVRILGFLDQARNNETVLAFIHSFTKGTIRGIHENQDDGQSNVPPSTDLLSFEAIECFIRLTHDRYAQELKKYLGTTVIAMFTDEPSILGRGDYDGRCFVPWTWGFLDDYTAAGLCLKQLPALFLDAGEKTQSIRKIYEHAVRMRLKRSFYEPISRWCERHSIALTGHPESSQDIGLLELFHIPGQDIVWRWVAPENDLALTGVHSTAAKCAADAARHLGRLRNANEVFGVCGPVGNPWAFTVDDMKWYLDYLFVRGCNMIIPHAFYYSLKSPMQYNERPPDVGPGNIWWNEYKQISQYIKRMSYIMTGTNQCRTAVLCDDDQLPYRSVRTLYENQIEFNYLNRSALLKASVEKGHIRIAKQKYNLVLVEDEALLADELSEVLNKFGQNGGRVIKIGSMSPQEIIDVVQCHAPPAVRIQPSSPDLRLSHVVLENVNFIVLTNEGDKPISATIVTSLDGVPEIWDPWENKCNIQPIFSYINGETYIPFVLRRRESLITVFNGDAPVLLDVPKPVDMQDTDEYNFIFEWPYPSGNAYLELGDVRDKANIYVNNMFVGTTLWSPHELTIPVEKGQNSLIINIEESMANKYGNPVPKGIQSATCAIRRLL